MNLIVKLSDGSFSHVPENDKRNIYYNFNEEILFLEHYINDYTPSDNKDNKSKKIEINEDNYNRESTQEIG